MKSRSVDIEIRPRLAKPHDVGVLVDDLLGMGDQRADVVSLGMEAATRESIRCSRGQNFHKLDCLSCDAIPTGPR